MYTVEADTGVLRPIGHVPVKQFPSSVVSHPSGKFIFVSAQTGMTIQSFRVNPVTGMLSEVKGSPFDPKVVSPFWLDVDSSGDFLFMAGRNSNAIGVMKIDQDTGTLSNVKGSPFAGGYLPRAVKVHPKDKHVYMTNINDDSVSAYEINRDSGILNVVGEKAYTAGDAPQFMAIHPNGRLMYMSSWNSKSLLAYALDQKSGVPDQLFEEQLGEDIYPFGIDMTPDGKYLYVASWFGGIAGYKVNAVDGRVTKLSGSPYQTFGEQPVQIFIEPSGRFAYVTNYESYHISSYRISSETGDLLPQSTVMARAGPRSMAFVMGEQAAVFQPTVLFALNSDSNELLSFRVHEDTGKLQQADWKKTGESPSDMSLSFTTGQVAVTNKLGNSISLYGYDSRSGKITASKKAPAQTGKEPLGISVDMNGRYVYAINHAENSMSVYYLNAAADTLDEAKKTALFESSPYAVAGQPVELVLHPTDLFAYVLNKNSNKLNIFKHYAYGPLVIDQSVPPSPIELPEVYDSLSFDGSGRFLFGLTPAGNLSAFAVNSRSGDLKALSKGRVSGIVGASGISADPVRPWVYVTNAENNTISVYALALNTGALTLKASTRLKAMPLDFVVGPSGRFAYVSLAGGAGLNVLTIDGDTGKLKPFQELKVPGNLSALAISFEIR